MEPMNNPMSNPNPDPMPSTVAGAGAPPVAQPVNPVVNPTAPVNPVVNPAAQVAPSAPVQAEVPQQPEMVQSEAVQPEAVQPAPIQQPTPVQPVAPVNPVFNPTGSGLVGATDPITMPAAPKAPDPVEEELKAPFKAAGPVPGSIGSAISVPAGAANVAANQMSSEPGRTPSVAFNDPAVANNQPVAKPVKKKTSKSTLIALAVVAGLVVLGLAGYLIYTLMFSN